MLNVLKKKQELPISIEKAWEFFSNPANLSKITPGEMNFRILTELPDKIYTGLIIEYKVSPFSGINSSWVTEITSVNEPYFFIDEQRFGPYKFWHHQHIFMETDNGVLMKDIVSYILPFGLIGNMALPLVRKKLSGIFEYRQKVLKELF